MNKLIIFDLDGVLVDSKDVHFDSLNIALRRIGEKFVITRDDHIKKYDGLPTFKKLELLAKEKGLPRELFKQIWEDKQQSTIASIEQNIDIDDKLHDIIKKLKENYAIALASNSIKKTVDAYLQNLGIHYLFDYVVSNEDIGHPKPFPEMYWKCMSYCGALPNETLIIEDSHIGITGAIDSGAHVLRVKDRNDVTLEKIENRLLSIHNKVKTYKADINILIPMAGSGSRFANAGYTFPKPIIDVNGSPMIAKVVENIAIDGNHIFVISKEHQEKYNMRTMLNVISNNCTVIEQVGKLAGAAHTTLLALDYIDNDKPLVIANSDQLIEYSSIDWMYFCESGNIDGCILLFKNIHPKWSYARIAEGNITEVAEKNPISDNATVGIYYWRRGSDYVKYAKQMIEKDIKTNGEFYVCPVYNEAIQDGKIIKPFFVDGMQGIGTPEDLEQYLKL